MSRTRKRRPGRPPLGDKGRSNVLSLKVSTEERGAWERAASARDVTLSEWIRGRCAPIARIEVSPDDGDWHWIAYSSDGSPLSCCGIAAGAQLEKRVLQAARDHGLVVGEGVRVEIGST